MIKSPPLKQLRPGNFRQIPPTIDMNQRREFVGPQSVLQPWHTVAIKVARYFTDVNGTVIDKTDAGLIAAGMVESYPVFILGEWDRQGGYRVGLSICPPIGNIRPLITFVNGVTGTSHNYITPFSIFNTIQQRLNIGDIVQVFVNDISSPSYFAWIVYSNNVAPLASIIANLATTQDDRRLMKLKATEINFVCTNFTLQLSEQWNYYHVDNIGRIKNNGISYNMFNTPMRVLPNVLTFQTSFDINQYVGIATYIISDIDEMTFNINTALTE